MKTITDNEIIDTSRGHKRLGGLFDENAMLRAQNDALVAALEDAVWLLRSVGINWKEAASMKDSCLRSAEDARAALKLAKGE